jgi:peptidoglycan/LPS O-acetylase OafA/YrhL
LQCIYVNHFLAAGLLLWLCEWAERDLFGYTNHPAFGWACVLLSVALAALTYRLIEAPIENVRNLVKRIRRQADLDELRASSAGGEVAIVDAASARISR